MRNARSKVKIQYPCSFCDKKLEHSIDLKEHLRLEHSDIAAEERLNSIKNAKPTKVPKKSYKKSKTSPSVTKKKGEQGKPKKKSVWVKYTFFESNRSKH
jgi:hypothetical protein